MFRKNIFDFHGLYALHQTFNSPFHTTDAVCVLRLILPKYKFREHFCTVTSHHTLEKKANKKVKGQLKVATYIKSFQMSKGTTGKFLQLLLTACPHLTLIYKLLVYQLTKTGRISI